MKDAMKAAYDAIDGIDAGADHAVIKKPARPSDESKESQVGDEYYESR